MTLQKFLGFLGNLIVAFTLEIAIPLFFMVGCSYLLEQSRENANRSGGNQYYCHPCHPCE